MIGKFTKVVLFCLLACGSAFAQGQNVTEIPVNTVISGKLSNVAHKTSSTCIDTLNMPFAGPLALYSVPGSGYVSGTNSVGDKAKAEYFATYSPFTHITGAIVYFGRATAAGANSSVNIAVWDNTGTGGTPGTIIATQAVKIDSIIADINDTLPTTVNFTTPVAITGSFFVGVQLSSTPGDTVAIITSAHNPAGPQTRAWEQLTNGNWGPYYSRWNVGGTGIRISHAIFPIVSSSANGTGIQPTAAFTVTGGSNVCANTPVTFNSSTSTNAVTYSWIFPGGTPSVSDSANPVVTYATPGTYPAQLKVTDGCSLTDTYTLTTAVTVKNSPTVTVNHNAPLLCGPNPTPVSITASGASSYTWSPAAGLNRTTGATVQASPATSTMYTVTGTANGCTSTAQVYVTVYNVVASFTAPDTAYLGDSVQFTNTSTGNAGNHWVFGNGITSGSENPITVFNVPGTYKVRLTRTIGNCTKTFDRSIVIVYRPVGLSEAFARGEVSVFPNPAQDYLQITSTDTNPVKQIAISNTIGQHVLNRKIDSGQARLDISTLPNGIYFVTMSNNEGAVTRKISIAR